MPHAGVGWRFRVFNPRVSANAGFGLPWDRFGPLVALCGRTLPLIQISRAELADRAFTVDVRLLCSSSSCRGPRPEARARGRLMPSHRRPVSARVRLRNCPEALLISNCRPNWPSSTCTGRLLWCSSWSFGLARLRIDIVDLYVQSLEFRFILGTHLVSFGHEEYVILSWY